MKINHSIQEIQTLSIKSIITESINPINIPENDYPLINILLFQNTKERFEKRFKLLQNKNLYPDSCCTYLNQGN